MISFVGSVEKPFFFFLLFIHSRGCKLFTLFHWPTWDETFLFLITWLLSNNNNIVNGQERKFNWKCPNNGVKMLSKRMILLIQWTIYIQFILMQLSQMNNSFIHATFLFIAFSITFHCKWLILCKAFSNFSFIQWRKSDEKKNMNFEIYK